jgi:hypothetical protein
MVKTPKTRHSKSSRDPVTIDLDADQVSRIGKDDPAGTEAVSGAVPPAQTPPETVEAAQTGEAPTEAPSGPAAESHARDYSFAEEPAPSPAPEPSAETDEPPARPALQTEPARRGGMGLLAAGLVGGVVALAGAGALQYAGILGAPGGGSANTAGGSQIAELQAQVSDLAAARDDDGSAQRIESLSADLGQLRNELASLKSAAEAGAASGGDNEALTELSRKVGEIESSVAARPEAVDLTPINDRLAALEQQVHAAGDSAEQQASRLDALDRSLATVSGKVEEQADQPRIALAIAASALKSALERGAPFKAELETFAAISPEAPQLDALRAYAEKGVATRSEIAAQVAAAADAMVTADKPVDENAGFVQRLMSSAESLVKVRPIGAVEGAGVPETVARLEAAVNRNDFAAALSEYETLPEAVKAAGTDFATALRSRMEAETQVDALVAKTMSGGEG